MREAEIEKIEKVKMTLETQVMNLESAAQNAETIKALKLGTDTMKDIRTKVGIENVDEVMDEIQDEMDRANEISEAISQPVDPYAHDDDDLLAELEGAMKEDEVSALESQLTAPVPTDTPLDLPDAPDSTLPQLTTNDEEEELRKLEAELAAS